MATLSARRTAVIADTASCVPPALSEQYAIEIVPFQLVWDGRTYLDGVDLTAAEFYRRFRSGAGYPTTATPTVAQFAAAYARVSQYAREIVVILTPEELTSVTQVARTAAEGSRVPISFVRTETAGPGLGFVVLEAARVADGGASSEAVVAAARACQARVGMYFAMETLEHLHRGGRIGQAATLLGSRLSIQPVLTVRGGVVRPVTITRSRSRALQRVLAETVGAVGDRPVRVIAFHADAEAEAVRLVERAERALRCVEGRLTDFTPVMGAHTGPGIVGLAYCVEAST